MLPTSCFSKIEKFSAIKELVVTVKLRIFTIKKITIKSQKGKTFKIKIDQGVRHVKICNMNGTLRTRGGKIVAIDNAVVTIIKRRNMIEKIFVGIKQKPKQ